MRVIATVAVAAAVSAAAGSARAERPLRVGFIAPVRTGLALLAANGRTTRLFLGYTLFHSQRLNTQMVDVEPIFARARGRTFAFEPSTLTFVPTTDTELRLAGGARLQQDGRRLWLTVRGRRDRVATLPGGVFVSERRDVLTLPGLTAARGYVVRADLNRMIPKGCRVATRNGARWFLLCGYPWGRGDATVRVLTPGGRVKTLVRAPRSSGWWTSAYLAPDAKTLLLQWSGECEAPSAWTAPASGGAARSVARDDAVDSVAHGWTVDGRAVVEFPRAVCGGGIPRPGVYLVDVRTGRKTYVRRAATFFAG